jgi:hypothetical protein
MNHCCRPKTVKKRCRPSEKRGNLSSRGNNVYCTLRSYPAVCTLVIHVIEYITMNPCPRTSTRSYLHAQKPVMRSRNRVRTLTATLASPSERCHRYVALRGPSSSYSDGPYQSDHAAPSCPSSRWQRPRCRPRNLSLHNPSHCAAPDTAAIERAQSCLGNSP